MSRDFMHDGWRAAAFENDIDRAEYFISVECRRPLCCAQLKHEPMYFAGYRRCALQMTGRAPTESGKGIASVGRRSVSAREQATAKIPAYAA
ncbi:MAG: hypothetical protein ACREO0_14760, partial [Pseudoxanthomonas sp.]